MRSEKSIITDGLDPLSGNIDGSYVEARILTGDHPKEKTGKSETKSQGFDPQPPAGIPLDVIEPLP